MLGVVLGVGALAAAYLSVTERVRGQRQRVMRRSEDLPVEPQPSEFSQALVELVATAGGIYLALILLRNFLKIELPERVLLFGLELEPMATLAFLVALVQPYFSHIHRSQR
ncbi:MAG: hypothetical protein GX062_00940 [Firmicutes bacterium]|jgi:hypothetical protein|nr:hypothetical protein [Bacillota bacterium]